MTDQLSISSEPSKCKEMLTRWTEKGIEKTLCVCPKCVAERRAALELTDLRVLQAAARAHFQRQKELAT